MISIHCEVASFFRVSKKPTVASKQEKRRKGQRGTAHRPPSAPTFIVRVYTPASCVGSVTTLRAVASMAGCHRVPRSVISKGEEALKKLIPLVLLCLAMPLMADEGMWMPPPVPQLSGDLPKLGIKNHPNSLADLTRQ